MHNALTLPRPASVETINLADMFDEVFPDAIDARGYNSMGDVLTQTVDGRPLNDVWADFQRALEVFNRQRSLIVDLLTYPVTNPIEDVPQIFVDDFEEASEYGEPKGIRGAGYFSLGYDFKWYDLAARFTWQYLAEASAAQVESVGNMALEADNRLVFQKVMKAVFNNVNRTASIRGQAVNVYSFYNNDGTVPPTYKNTTFASTHQHYVTSGAATVDPTDLRDLELLVSEHGYGAANGSKLVLMVNKAEGNVIRTFRVGTASAIYDFIPAQSQPPFLLPTNTGGIQGGQAPATLGGLTVIGSYGPLVIIEEDYIPAGYMFLFATGGESNLTNPVGIREHANSGLRGLRLVKGREPDYPLIDSFYQRGFGTGIRQRGAGAVMQITAAGAYTIPAAYA
jgi:hypothetical protein